MIPFSRFDPRLKADLKRQWKPLTIGLLCVVLTAGLTAATIPLIQRAVSAIARATPTGSGEVTSPLQTGDPRLQKIAQEVGVDAEKLGQAAAKIDAEEGTPRGEAVRRQAVDELLWISLFVVALYGLKYWFTRGSVFFIGKASTLLANDLRVRIFDRLQSLPVAYFNRMRAGAIQSVLTNDANVYTNAVNVVKDSIDGPIKIVTGLTAIIWISPMLALITAAFVPVIGLVVRMNSRQMKKAAAVVQEDLASLQAFTQEAVQGTRVIKAFGAEGRIMQQYRALVQRYYHSNLVMLGRQSSLKPLVELVGAAALATVIYLCGWLAFRSELDVASVTALVYALDVVNQGWRALGYVRNTLAQVEAASDRIYNEILDVPVVADPEGAQTIPNLTGKLEFRNVGFDYPDGTPALRDVSFTLEPGTSLALVGPSGAGKSTIADLILKFYEPTRGQILVDGVDLREIRTEWWRNQIGVVPQQTFLFAGSLAENLRMASPNATAQDLEEASQAAHALPFVNRFPERFEAQIGEHGAGLSGGERQRVAIARALVRKPAMLLFDEATSNLDAESEKAVTEALDELMRERTSLFIAHRLTTAARANKIVVLRRGEVLEQGAHRELMEREGAYSAMMKAFSAGLVEDSLG